MQKLIKEPLIKERSPRAVLSAGFRFYAEHFRRLFKGTWLAALVASLISGAAATTVFIYWPELIVRIYSDVSNAWQYAGEYRLMLVVVALLHLLVLLTFVFFAWTAASTMLTIHEPQNDSWWVRMRHAFGYWMRLIWRSITGVRYWGRFLVAFLVCAIVLGIITLVVSLPAVIIYQANWEARIGVVGGDPLGMPSYVTALTFATCTFITFLQLYIWLPLLVCIYYTHGAIVTREKNKNKKKQE